MNITLIKALVALLPVAMVLAWSITVLSREKALGATLQCLGAGFLLVVVLTHVAEARHLFAFMRWGAPRSAGHYLDLSSAILGLTLFPTGLALRAKANAARRAGA